MCDCQVIEEIKYSNHLMPKLIKIVCKIEVHASKKTMLIAYKDQLGNAVLRK
jgi:hypothetical protein